MYEDKDYLTLKEVLEYIGMSRSLLYCYINKIGIKVHKSKKIVYLHINDVEKIKNAQMEAMQAKKERMTTRGLKTYRARRDDRIKASQIKVSQIREDSIMSAAIDENGIEYATHNGHQYYNWTNASRYVEMTDSGFRRKVKAIEAENGISIPLIRLPFSQQNVYHDRRILDVFRKAVKVGREQEWLDELRRVVDTVNNED